MQAFTRIFVFKFEPAGKKNVREVEYYVSRVVAVQQFDLSLQRVDVKTSYAHTTSQTASVAGNMQDFVCASAARLFIDCRSSNCTELRCIQFSVQKQAARRTASGEVCSLPKAQTDTLNIQHIFIELCTKSEVSPLLCIKQRSAACST
jgi:hypothetical protein